jgi:putative sugar O-methyltransferase
MQVFKELNHAWDDMQLQDNLYQPSAFWNEASMQIKNELILYGIEKFRSLETALGYFVPTYGTPGNSFTKEMAESLGNKFKREFPNDKKPSLALEQFLNGYLSALSDYRVYVAADIPASLPYLNMFSESNFGDPVEQFDFGGRKFSRSSLNYLLGLTMLKKHLNGTVPKTILEIGGGFGSLGEILLCSGVEDIRYIDIDIPPTSYVAQKYLSFIFGKQNVATYEHTHELANINIGSLPKASVLCSWQIEKLYGRVDLFVNFISFQEMEPHIVKNYLNHVTRLSAKWILLRNIREGKNIRNEHNEAGVEIPIFSDDYINMLEDYELIDRNVIPFGYKTVDNFHSELLLLKHK